MGTEAMASSPKAGTAPDVVGSNIARKYGSKTDVTTSATVSEGEREANKVEVPTRLTGKVGATGAGLTLAFIYGHLLQTVWSFGYESTKDKDAPYAETDVRSWEDASGKMAALAAHAVVGATGMWLAHSLGPYQTTSWTAAFVSAGLALAYASAGDAVHDPVTASTLASWSLPSIAGMGAAVGAILFMRLDKAAIQQGARKARGGCCSVFFYLLCWWVLLCGLLLAHADVTIDSVAMKLPKDCKGVAGLNPGAQDAWQLPEWHQKEYFEHLKARCKAHKEGIEGGQEPSLKHGVKLGPLLVANREKVGKLVQDMWNEVAAAIRASGGWRAFGEELYAKLRDQTGNDYSVLGLEEGASLAEVKAAYRGLARKLHPDRLREATPEQREASTAQFRKVSEAYERLSAQLTPKTDEGGASETERAAPPAEEAPARRSRRRKSD